MIWPIFELCNRHIVLAIGGLNGFVSTEVQNSTSVLRLKFSAKNPAHRQYAARCVLCDSDTLII
jgi:hypothetical protein